MENQTQLLQAYNILDNALEDVLDGHDCHASPDDGCDCITIGFMRMELNQIYEFIIKVKKP